MDNEPQITFHQLPQSPALEEDIRRSIAHLETLFERIVSCRVVVDAPHRHHHQGWRYRVRIDIAVPGEHLAIGSTPDQDSAHEDPYVAARDAFRAARRRLEDYARCRRGEVKTHAAH